MIFLLGAAKERTNLKEQAASVQQEGFSISDPTPELTPTAKRILDAGVRVLDRQGFGGLTFERIAQESKENGALIRYHFGSKAGLIRALVDAVLFSQARGLLHRLTPLAPGKERRDALFQKRFEVTTDRVTFRRMFEVSPYAWRDPELRPKYRDLMRWYREFDSWVYGTEHPDAQEKASLEPLATLMSAMINGIALQLQADPDLDVKPAFDLWEQFVNEYLEKLQGKQATVDKTAAASAATPQGSS
jgi:AcrR family transcriptional regulator